MFAFINFLRAIAVMLIANSHFKQVYPSDIMSFGGGFGLALFYMISGYLLGSIQSDTKFGNWYLKKMIRLYVPLFLYKTIMLIIGSMKIASVGEAIKRFVFPGSWFGASLVLLYPIYFTFVKYIYTKAGMKSIITGLSILFVLYSLMFVLRPGLATFSLETLKIEPLFSIETPYLISLVIWMMCMLIGLYIRHFGHVPGYGNRNLMYFFASFFFVVLFMVIKLLIQRGKYINVSYMLAVSYIGFAYCLFTGVMAWEEMLNEMFRTIPGRIIYVLSESSLEIYYVQIFWIQQLYSIWFPLNWFMLVICIVTSGYILHTISNMISERLWMLMNQT